MHRLTCWTLPSSNDSHHSPGSSLVSSVSLGTNLITHTSSSLGVKSATPPIMDPCLATGRAGLRPPYKRRPTSSSGTRVAMCAFTSSSRRGLLVQSGDAPVGTDADALGVGDLAQAGHGHDIAGERDHEAGPRREAHRAH